MSDQKSRSEALFDAAVDVAKEKTSGGLSEIRAHAVYARIKGDLRRERRTRWSVVALLGALAGALIAFLILRPVDPPAPPRIAEVVYRSAGVRLETGNAVLAEDATEIAAGARLDLDDGARVDLDLRGAAKVAVFGPAQVARAEDGTIGLKKGRAAFSVEPHERDAPFVVRVGSDRVVVHGTKFDVHVEAGRLSRVDVTEGRVEVQREGEAPAFLGGGESLAIDPAVQAANRASFDAPWWHTRAIDSNGYLLVETEPAGAEVVLDGLAIGRSPLLVRWSAGDMKVGLALDGYVSWSGSIRIDAGAVARLSKRFSTEPVEVEEAPEERPRSRTDHWKKARALLKAGKCAELDRKVKRIVKESGHAEAARAEMLGAECQLRRGKKAIALDRYLEIERRYRSTASAEAALFEAASIEADLERRESALAHTELYLERHPSGRFAEGAAVRRCELLVAANRVAEGRACLERYRHDHPSGVRASQALLLLATIARIEGRWAEAVPAYREYLSRSPSSEHAEKAHHRLIECLLRGMLDGADEEIAKYLERYPDGAGAEEVRKWQRARSSSR